MNARYPTILLCMSLMVLTTWGAEEPPKKQASKEEIQARLAEHAKRKSAEVATASAAAVPKENVPVSPTAAPVARKGSSEAPAKPVIAASGSPKVLPRVEVRKERITELDRQVDKQNREIAREKKNTKPTPLDTALNGPKISGVLALFGGQSSDDRSAIAQERISMMEEERDLIEAIDQAATKEEKDQLQKTLDSMKAMRRELEQSLR